MNVTPYPPGMRAHPDGSGADAPTDVLESACPRRSDKV